MIIKVEWTRNIIISVLTASAIPVYVLPTHRVFQTISNALNGQSFFLTAVVGFVYFGFLMIWVTREFLKRHFQ